MNTEETLTLNFFRMFPRLCTHAAHVEDGELGSRVCSPIQHYGTKCLYNNASFCANLKVTGSSLLLNYEKLPYLYFHSTYRTSLL